ncbi:hypothetical protein [Demequina globuliformis]|uniref:hypothetical protein n=1 Tax=Demequina globuliformis TaxID=676202 RepID=UPI000784324A|nr:hypothetical protein [Demequina globuliformis]
MRTSARRLTAVLVAGLLATGVTACGNLPDIDPSNLPTSLPSLSRGPDPSETPAPEPTATEEPAPVVTATQTAQPEPEATQSSAPEPTPTTTGEGETAADADSVLWWPWALAAVVLLITIIAVARRGGARSAWDRRLASARGEFAWFEDSLVPQIVAQPSAQQALSLWQSGRPRMLGLDQELHALTSDAPTDARQDAAGQGLQALRTLTAAVDADAGGSTEISADDLRAHRAAVDAARAQARAWLAAVQK